MLNEEGVNVVAGKRLIVRNTFLEFDETEDEDSQPHLRRSITAPAKSPHASGGPDNNSDWPEDTHGAEAPPTDAELPADQATRPQLCRVTTREWEEPAQYWFAMDPDAVSMSAVTTLGSCTQRPDVPPRAVQALLLPIGVPCNLASIPQGAGGYSSPSNSPMCYSSPSSSPVSAPPPCPPPMEAPHVGSQGQDTDLPPPPARQPGESPKKAAPAAEAQPLLSRVFSQSSSLQRVSWKVDSRLLATKDREKVSPLFDIPLNQQNVEMKIVLRAKSTHDSRGGNSFKQAKGQGSMELMCVGDAPSCPLKFRFVAMSGADEEPVRQASEIVEHDFSERKSRAVQQEWDFGAGVSEGHFVVSLEVLVTG
eukprot:TRINITY_DN7715_c0_g4_i1.p1 TRINITY_DN7715_c0_g4~~TRINITY_DN7715_c0_g4_i1.p1  ORF type:complete len:365 (+),score=53.36 TRINITY_DN7715_c0_g4_i1:85-1179(+)